MTFLTICIALLLSFFSTAIMSYISMATAIGPWIEPTLVLMGMLIMRICGSWYSSESKAKVLGLATVAGGIGGILATACGFSYPALYFIDKAAFSTFLANPLYFAFLLTLLALAAGSLGLVTAHMFEHGLIVKTGLPFPIGELVFKMITAADNMKKAVSLAIGFAGTTTYLIIRSFSLFLAGPWNLLSRHSLSLITLPKVVIPTDQLPMFWSIGFVTGHVIAMPLFLGLLARIFCIEPLHYLFPSFWFQLSYWGIPLKFISPGGSTISLDDFTIAFCSGMVVYGAGLGFLGVPRLLRSVFNSVFHSKEAHEDSVFKSVPWIPALLTLVFNCVVLSYFQFSFLAQLYLILFTLICTYQMAYIAGEMGLAPLGRFATFVMVPGMILFGYSAFQAIFVSTFVEISGGVACDALFGRKMGYLAAINRTGIHWYQWLGLLASSLLIGCIFWIYITQFGLGSEPGALAVTKAASRALLINVKSFDLLVVGLGIIFGIILRAFKVNTMLLLGGILMPVNYSFMLILGGLSTYLVRDKEAYYPFCSGVFAANSLWMLIRAFI